MKWLVVMAMLSSLLVAGCQSTAPQRDDDKDRSNGGSGYRGTHNYSKGP
ncbi:MAG: hypothetical protein RIM84_12530 [Alphaproteobacteria bacterium]